MLKSIDQKAIALSLLIALLVMGCCGVGAWVALELSRDLNNSARSAEMLQTHMDGDMMHDALRADVLAAVVARDPAFGVALDDVRKDLGEHAAQFRKDLAANEALARTDVQRTILNALREPLDAYVRAAEHMVDLIKQDPGEAGRAMPEFLARFKVMEGVMAHASDQLEAEQKADTARGEDESQRASAWMFSLMGVGVALAAFLAFLVRKALVRPLANITAAMKRLAAGELTIEIGGAGRQDEIGAMASALMVFKNGMIERQKLQTEAAALHRSNEEKLSKVEEAFHAAAQDQSVIVDSLAEALQSLARGDLTGRISIEVASEYQRVKDDFNATVERLQQTMVTVGANAQAIRSGTGEISSAAEDLSRRTERQAASLEETAASLDEITATVNKTAAGAKHARDIVSTAKSSAEKSGEIVRQAIEAMSGIEKSSKQIGQIIGVIDEIAFQTNLLALNAGVEAARAGDAGRGFAVVASEVRALAQRSAEAAKEIKGLISTSTAQVDQGVELVGEAGKALQQIVAQVAEINAEVSGIAASAEEQASGLHEVNTAVNHMDQVTQQNAAMVEQTTAAARALSQETEALTHLISGFQTGRAANVQPINRPAKAPAAVRPALKSARA